MVIKMVILFFSGLIFCNCQLNNTEELKVAHHLYVHKYISKSEFENKKGFLIRNIKEETCDLTSEENDFFVVSTGSHGMVCYFMYNKGIQFLDVQSFKSLLNALDVFYNYALEQNYSKEKISSHINILVRAYYRVNKNVKTRKTQYLRDDTNCKFREDKVSGFSLTDIKNTFSERGNVQDVFIKRYDMYYGLPKINEKLNIGVYSYVTLDSAKPNPKILLLYKDKMDIFEIRNNVDVYTSIKEILIFGEENSICSEETLWVVRNLVFERYQQ